MSQTDGEVRVIDNGNDDVLDQHGMGSEREQVKFWISWSFPDVLGYIIRSKFVQRASWIYKSFSL